MFDMYKRPRETAACVFGKLLDLAIKRRREFHGERQNSTSQGEGNEPMALTLDEADRIIRGALTKAQELNIKVSAAVCDSGGRLIALQRMDNAIWASVYGSQGKALASAAFGRASGELTERADQPTPRGIAAASGGHMIMGQGAVPIIRNGIVEGACGVGGGTSQQDEDCARAGVAQL
jgi:glc operon protein GlcG